MLVTSIQTNRSRKKPSLVNTAVSVLNGSCFLCRCIVVLGIVLSSGHFQINTWLKLIICCQQWPVLTVLSDFRSFFLVPQTFCIVSLHSWSDYAAKIDGLIFSKGKIKPFFTDSNNLMQHCISVVCLKQNFTSGFSVLQRILIQFKWHSFLNFWISCMPINSAKFNIFAIWFPFKMFSLPNIITAV